MAEKIMILLGILSVGYFAGIAFYAGMSSKFPFIWLVFGNICFAAAFLMHKRVQIPTGLKVPGAVIFWMLLVIFVYTEVLMIGAMLHRPDAGLDYIIVLGAQVKGDRPSLSLKYRIDEAQKYLENNPDTKAILSGGKGPEENISEAECMCKELMKRGIEKSRLIKEDKSTSTSENISFSNQILKERYGHDREKLQIGIVTNNFHVFRGTAIARKKMEGRIQGIPARSNSFLQVNYLVREFLGVVKDKLAGNL